MIYEKEYTNQISFPLGGIGTGSIGLSGTGRLIDWEISGRPNKQSYNGYSHFAIKVEKDGKVLDTRILNADLAPPYMGGVKTENIHSGFGFGPDQITMAGFPHFKEIRFEGEFPVANLVYRDEHFPSEVKLTAFNPMIPSDAWNSSIPAAFFEFEIGNPTEDDLDYMLAFSVSNPTGTKKVSHRYEVKDGIRHLRLDCGEYAKEDYHFGNLCISTDCEDTSCQEYWYRGGWSDGVEMYWNDLTGSGKLKNRRYESDYTVNQQVVHDVGTLAAHVHIPAGKAKKIRFVLSWYYPNIVKSWEVKYHPEKRMEDMPVWRNFYASMFPSSCACAAYAMKNFDSLRNRTLLFKNTLFRSSLPKEELDAVASNLSTLKSAAVLRLTDGSFYGFEGCIEDAGCCEGSCQHVWNYAYALPFLFPELERSMRDLELKYSMAADGRMGFRLQLPLGTPPADFRACVDGQMGFVVKVYREWKISGDDKWLKENWMGVKKALEYAWSEENEDLWDEGCTGVLRGRQHHTLDMELFGANSWLQGFYLCALKAAGAMAEYLGDTEKAELYRDIFQKGKAWTDSHLFNGSYYCQDITLSDQSVLEPYKDQACLFGDGTLDIYWNEENGEIKYQIGEGCMIDQVIGQWHANNCGLGEIFNEDQTKKSLKSIYQNNYHKSMREIANPWRLYNLNDEGGTMICTWPEGKRRPAIPLTYNSETMHGYEYQFACHLAQMGMWEESHEVVKAVRDKYDGYKRNPYNEIECGSNYARSMASYGLLLAYGGFCYDMAKGMIGFYPRTDVDKFETFWSLDGAWGRFCCKGSEMEFQVMEGSIKIKEFRWGWMQGKLAEQCSAGVWRQEEEVLYLEEMLREGERLLISCKG